jgi:hypothetical protein
MVQAIIRASCCGSALELGYGDSITDVPPSTGGCDKLMTVTDTFSKYLCLKDDSAAVRAGRSLNENVISFEKTRPTIFKYNKAIPVIPASNSKTSDHIALPRSNGSCLFERDPG